MVRHAPWDADAARAIIARLSGLDGATLPILHALQEEFGCVPAEAVPLIADALNVSRAEIHGAITFYHDFRDKPAGRRVIKLCRAEACQASGSNELVDHLRTRHGIAIDSTTADGALTVETVYCLGNCALGPSALIDGDLVGRVDANKLSAVCGGALPADCAGEPA